MTPRRWKNAIVWFNLGKKSVLAEMEVEKEVVPAEYALMRKKGVLQQKEKAFVLLQKNARDVRFTNLVGNKKEASLKISVRNH